MIYNDSHAFRANSVCLHLTYLLVSLIYHSVLLEVGSEGFCQ